MTGVRTPLRLRPATTDDLVRVAGWIDSEAALVQWSGTGSWPVTVDQLLPALAEPGVRLLTGLDAAGAAVALVRLTDRPDATRLGWVIVDPARRGEGLGTALVDAAVATAFAAGATRITLGVHRHNTAARRLYYEAGFLPTGEQRSMIVGGESWHTHEMVLTRPDRLRADPRFSDPRLARAYDPLDPDRSDLDHYLALAGELGARSVLDIGCGTGTFGCLLARAGFSVVGVDPAAASLAVARTKPDADRVRWVHGTASDVLPVQVDLVTMTANVAQVFTTESGWYEVLGAARAALRPGGHLVFETRDPARRAWQEWTSERSRWSGDIPGVGAVSTRDELVEVFEQWVTFRWTIRFESDGETLTSTSTLRFWERDQLRAALAASGFMVRDVRDAPDRPGREFVFVARRD